MYIYTELLKEANNGLLKGVIYIWKEVIDILLEKNRLYSNIVLLYNL